MTTELDYSKFDAAILRLIDATGAPLDQLLRQQARLLLKQIIDYTPPKTQRQGEQAVKRDISKLFLGFDMTHLTAERARKVPVVLWTSPDGQKAFAVEPNRLHTGPQQDTIRQIHNRGRSSQGRVQGKRHFSLGRGSYQMINRDAVPAGELAKYIAAKQANVGMMRSGWAVGYVRMGASLPAWITRHNERVGGATIALGGLGESTATFWNSAPGIGRTKHFVSNALRRRAAAMAKDVGFYLSGIKTFTPDASP